METILLLVSAAGTVAPFTGPAAPYVRTASALAGALLTLRRK